MIVCESKKAVNEITASGKICVLDVEMQGVQNVKKANMNALYVFIQPPDMHILVSYYVRSKS